MKEEGNGEQPLSFGPFSSILTPGNSTLSVPFGLLVWSTGLAPNPLVESIAELKHDEKTHGYEFPTRCKLSPSNLFFFLIL